MRIVPEFSALRLDKSGEETLESRRTKLDLGLHCSAVKFFFQKIIFRTHGFVDSQTGSTFEIIIVSAVTVRRQM